MYMVVCVYSVQGHMLCIQLRAAVMTACSRSVEVSVVISEVRIELKITD